MKLHLNGWKATVAKYVASFSVIALFMVGGALAGIGPYTIVTAPVGLVLLIAVFYNITSTEEIERYPRHFAASAGMLASSFVFFVAMTNAPTSLLSLPGVIAAVSLVTMIGLGVWKDHVLGDYERIDDFRLELFHSK